MTQTHRALTESAFEIGQLPSPPVGVWWLFGTDGCHLCDEAYKLLQTAKCAYPIPLVIRQDIMYLSDECIQMLALHIPVLVGQGQRLYWQFGLADVVAFYEHQNTIKALR